MDDGSLLPEKVAEVVVDLWKIMARVHETGSSDRIQAACERAWERLRRLGFEAESMIGEKYDTNMRVKVVDHEEAQEPLSIVRCLSPAVYFHRTLVKEAEVVTRGE